MLAVTNPHPKDSLLTFREINHKYVHTPSGLKIRKSVTLFLQTFFPNTFDARAVVDSNLAKWADDPNSKYHPLIQYLQLVQSMNLTEVGSEIVKLWNANGKKARDDGTAMHLALENWMNDVDQMDENGDADHDHSYAIGMVSRAFKTSFYPSLDLKPYRSEFRVVLTTDVYVPAMAQTVEIPVIAGTIDAIYKDRFGRWIVVDWKRIDPSKKGLLGVEKANSRFAQHASGILKKFVNTPFLQYTCQLIVYKLLLQRGNYIGQNESVGPLFLCQIHPTMTACHFVEAGNGLGEDDLDELEVLLGVALDGLVQETKSAYLADLQSKMDAETEEEDEDEDEEDEDEE